MVDPSIYSTRDFTVNCFAKQRDLLPEPAIGDVALFRDVQVCNRLCSHETNLESCLGFRMGWQKVCDRSFVQTVAVVYL